MTKEQVTFKPVSSPWWGDRPVIIVGAGPSLKGFNLNRLRGLGYVVALNGAMFHLPWADAWLTIDLAFIKAHADFLQQDGPPLYIGLATADCVGGPYPPQIQRAIYLHYKMLGGVLSTDPAWLSCGGTTGFTGLNFATLKRGKFIALFGYDYDYTGHFDETPYAKIETTPNWPLWAQMFDPVGWSISGVRVINANPTSKVTAFPRMTHDDAIEALQ